MKIVRKIWLAVAVLCITGLLATVSHAEPGLNTQWHHVSGLQSIGNFDAYFGGTAPSVPVFTSVHPYVATFNGGVGHPQEIIDAGLTGGTDRSVKWTGQINLPVAGTYNFKSGVDHFRRLIIDGQTVMSETSWTNFNGVGGQGDSSISPFVVTEPGWKDIEFAMSENCCGTYSALYWDYDATLGLNANVDFPNANNVPAGIGALIPTEFVRTEADVIPEPSTLTLAALGLLSLLGFTRRRRR